MRIKLTRGLWATVDDDCPPEILERRWHATGNGYACRRERVDGRSRYVLMHRAIAGAKDGQLVDHVSGDTLDNRRENLRVCTHRENIANQRLSRRSTSGYKGVSFDKARDKWLAYVCPGGRQIHLGRFDSAIEAARAYDRAAAEHFGEYARLNGA